MAPKPDRLAFIFGMVLADGGGHDVGGPFESRERFGCAYPAQGNDLPA